MAEKEQGCAWEREWTQTAESNASTTEAKEVPSSEWFAGRCNEPSYNHDEMIFPRFTHTLDNKTSDEHKTQLLHHTDDTRFHRLEQTVFTDRRNSIRDTDRHLGAPACGAVAMNNCDSVYYNSGKISDTVPNNNNDVNDENVVGVCDFQVLHDTQYLSLRSEMKTCSFGCQFPEVDAANAGVHVLPGEVTKQSACVPEVPGEVTKSSARVPEMSGVRPEVGTDQHTGDSTSVGQMPHMESNKPRERVDRTRCSDDAFTGEPNKIEDYSKGDKVRENSDGIDEKQKAPKVSNNEVRKVEQRDRKCTERGRIAKENGQPQCKHEQQKILEELKAGDGYRGFNEDDHTAVVDADGHKEPETDVTQRTVEGNRGRRLRNSDQRPSDNREVPCRPTTDDKQKGSGVKAEHGRPIEGVCSHGASEVGCGKHVKKSQGKQIKKKKKKYHDRLMNIKTVNRDDGATSTDDGEFNVGRRGDSGATGSANNKRKRRNYPRMHAKTKDENLDDGGSDVTSHRKMHDDFDICRKESEGGSAQRRKTTLKGANNQKSTPCKDEPRSERHIVKMTLKPSERVGSSNKQHRLGDQKETIVRAKEIKADQESSKEITIRNIAQDKNHLTCFSRTGFNDQTLVNGDNGSGKVDCVEGINTGADCNELGRKKGWRSRRSYKGIDRRHQHRTYYKGSKTKKPETGEDVQKGNGTRKLEVDMQVKDIGAKILRNSGNWDSSFGKPWSESCGGEQGEQTEQPP